MAPLQILGWGVFGVPAYERIPQKGAGGIRSAHDRTLQIRSPSSRRFSSSLGDMTLQGRPKMLLP